MELKPYVVVLNDWFAIAKDGYFVAVDPESGHLFVHSNEILRNKKPTPFQPLMWSHPIHHLGNVYFIIVISKTTDKNC